MIRSAARINAAMFLFVCAPAHGQSIRAEDAFAVPPIQLECEIAPPDSTIRPGEIVLIFSGDTLTGRVFEARYDSTGTVRLMNVSVTKWVTPALMSTELFAAGFTASDGPSGIHMWIDPATGPPARRTDLTPDQLALARQLAIWFWARRCDKPNRNISLNQETAHARSQASVE